MDIENTHVTSLKVKIKIKFLGVIIYRSKHRKFYKGSSFKKPKAAWLGQCLRLTAPLDIIKAKLRQANFISDTFKGKPKFI
jgi:hypothetical protein